MRYIPFLIIFLSVTTIIKGQNQIETEFFNRFKDYFFLDEDYLRYDNGFGKEINDSVMVYMMKNKQVKLPESCDSLMNDFSEFTYCVTGNMMESGFLIGCYNKNYNEEIHKDSLMDYFIEYLSEKTRDYDIHFYEKINIRIFKYIDSILTYFDPETYEMEEEDEYTYVMLLTMYQ